MLRSAWAAFRNEGIDVVTKRMPDTHQVLTRTDKYQGKSTARRLESNNIITSSSTLFDDILFMGASGNRWGFQGDDKIWNERRRNCGGSQACC